MQVLLNLSVNAAFSGGNQWGSLDSFKGSEMDDFIGRKFGRLTVIDVLPREWDEKWKMKPMSYKCQCECGNQHDVLRSSLLSGRTNSCGCYRRESTGRMFTTHGLGLDPLYTIWKGIKARTENCNSESFKNYGDRNITLHPAWANDFQLFYTYVKENLGDKPSPDHSLDRIENDGNYEPGNLRWGSLEQQANNKRNNIVVTFQGVTDTLPNHCRRLGLKYSTVTQRLNVLGWSVEEAFTLPVGTILNKQPLRIGSLADKCRDRGRDYATVSKRISKGWTVEQALGAPTDGKYHHRPR